MVLIPSLSLFQNGSLGKPLYSFYFASEMTNTTPFSRRLNNVLEETERDLPRLPLWIRGSSVGTGQMISEKVYSRWPHKSISHTDDSEKVTLIKAIGN